jgi:hypothetical protein
MPVTRFEPDIPASDRPQMLILDRSADGIGSNLVFCLNFSKGIPSTVSEVKDGQRGKSFHE